MSVPQLAADKIAHLKGGALVLVGSASVLVLGQALGAHAITTGLALAGFLVGAAVEYAQQQSNERLVESGLAPLHDVSLADLIASAAPCWVAAAAWEFACRVGFLS